MKRSRLSLATLGVLALLLVPVLASCGSTGGGATNTPAPTVKVGLVTDTGGLNDKGFNHLAFLGLQKAEKDFKNVKGEVKQSTSDADYVPNLTAFASQGDNLVIAVGFLMAAAVGQVAQQFPNVHFAIIDSTASDAKGNTLTLANVEPLLFHEQEAGALVGTIAGLLEKGGQTKLKKNTISAVGGVSIPPVDRYIAGYIWASKMEDPGLQVLVGYSNDFSDPTPCKNIATNQIGKGADIVFQVAGGCGLGALQAADTAGVYGIGVDTDQSADATSVIASAVKRVDTATYDAIKDVVNNNFQGSNEPQFTLQNGGVGFAPGNFPNINSDATITAELTRVENGIKGGSLTPPTARTW
jgi:basic membrane protein A and related proteins